MRNEAEPIVTEVLVRVRARALEGSTSWAHAPAPTMLIQELRVQRRERKETQAMWPYWEEEEIEGSSDSDV